jgi:hypothetical protein
MRVIGARIAIWLVVVLGGFLLAGDLLGQEFGARLGQVKRGGKVSFEPTGPGVVFDALDPVLRKWYVPQELYAEYGWQPREYSNYSRDLYQRYVSTAQEGEYFYDVYGNYLMRGWLVYDWRQENPQPFGSAVEKSSRFSSWFSNLVIASDHKGQYHYAVTISNRIRTTLTPMTFSKPLFDGLQWDFVSDKYEGTLLLSRISDTGSSGSTPQQRTDNTNLIGGRLEIQIGDFVTVGGTFVNAHQIHTQVEAFSGNMFTGSLTGDQNATNLGRIDIRISDASPEDGEGGGALFANDIIIYDLEGNRFRGSEIGFRALVEGGFQRRGFLAADGIEEILISYDFNDRTYAGPDISEIKQVRLELVVANDYLIEMASDRQPVFLEMARAVGNVKDNSNQRVVSLDYGIPTANQIAGLTVEVDDLAGFKGYLEMNVNQRYRQYPNPNRQQHHTASTQDEAFILNVSQSTYPFFAFGELFRVDPGYSTSMSVVDSEGEVDFDNDFFRYEFVEDNDDQDRIPDWRRKGWEAGDREIFPGWDENNDFISDFNQNDNEDSPNLVPDYEESFLRYNVDRPEFLYGVDMNHNGWVDRFENDEEADYPYKRDRKGYNFNFGFFMGENARLSVGRQRVEQISDDRRNRATYLVLTARHDIPLWGGLRLFEDLRSVKDDIVDDLFQWVQLPDTRGGQRLVEDPLAAVDTWINTTWLGLDFTRVPGLEVQNKFKWQLYHQRQNDVELELRDRRKNASFTGLINKTEYRWSWRRLTLVPRWKSEFLRRVDVVRSVPKRVEWTQLYMFLVRFPVLRSSFIEGGVEYERFRQLRDPVPPGASDSFTGTVLSAQLTNLSDYLGYRLTTILGLEVARRRFEFDDVETRTRGFVTVFAGVQ